jgi:hypothetical protein
VLAVCVSKYRRHTSKNLFPCASSSGALCILHKLHFSISPQMNRSDLRDLRRNESVQTLAYAGSSGRIPDCCDAKCTRKTVVTVWSFFDLAENKRKSVWVGGCRYMRSFPSRERHCFGWIASFARKYTAMIAPNDARAHAILIAVT